MNLHPADFDPTPVQKRSIIQAPIMYPEAPSPQMMTDYMGAPPSSGAELSMAAALDTPMYTAAPAPQMMDTELGAPPAPQMMDAPAAPFPEMAYSTPSSRLGAPR